MITADVDENVEEGEATQEPQLDVEKIIEYEGFTVEMGPDVIDVSTKFTVLKALLVMFSLAIPCMRLIYWNIELIINIMYTYVIEIACCFFW